MSSGLDELEAQLASLKRKQADLKAEARRERKRQKKKDEDHHVAQVLHSAGLSQVVPNLAKWMPAICDLFLLFELSGFCNDVVVSYALGMGRPDRFQTHGYEDKWEPGLRSRISSGFDIIFETLDEPFLIDNLANCHPKHLLQLCKYIVEYKLFLWMVGLNCDKGIYPPIALLLVQAVKCIPGLAPQHIREQLKAYFSSMGSTTYQWAASFTERWGTKLGVQQAGEDVEPELLRTKAAWLPSAFFAFLVAEICNFWCQFWANFGGHFWDPKLGPGMQFLLRILLRAQFRGPKQGPFLVPISGPRNCIFSENFWKKCKLDLFSVGPWKQ